MSPLAPILQEYFTAYLMTQRAMSEATVRAYRDTWRLFLTFLSRIMQVPAHQLQLTHLDPAHVVAFLEHLEQERGNSAATRNLRLAAIKSVMAFCRSAGHPSAWTPSPESTPSPSRSTRSRR